MPVVTQKIKVSELPASAALNATQWLYVEDEAFAAISQRSRRISPLAWDTRYLQDAAADGITYGRLNNAWVAVAGAAIAGATYITQTPHALLANEQALSALATGILKSTTGTGVISIAAAGVDYQSADAFLTSIAALGTAANKLLYTTGVDVAAEADLTAFARTLLDDADAVTMRATIGAGTTTLPVVDETAIVFETGVPANTLTFDVTPFTAARIVTWPDAAMTVAGLEVANVFTAAQKINVNSATALVVEQDGVKDNVLVVDTANGRVGIRAVPSYTLDVSGGGDVGSQLHFSYTGLDSGGYLASFAANNFFMAGGASFVVGTGWVAKSTAASLIGSAGTAVGDLAFYTNAALVVGNVYTPTLRMVILNNGNVGVGVSGPLAKLHVDQASMTAAIPVLTLDQADLSEEFIRFVATIGAGNPIDTAALGAYYGKVRVYVEGVGAKWLALYD